MSQEPALPEQYAQLRQLSDNAPGPLKRKRGFDFERVLKRLLDADGLEPRSSYKAKGEQIDGSFYLDGTFILLEAKWHADPIPASTLYQFKGKVDGKLVGTLGVFISMSGYSEDAVDALTAGKSLNLILFNKEDIDAAIAGKQGFKTILKAKLRKAAEEGLVYYPTAIELVESAGTEGVAVERLHFDRMTDRVIGRPDSSSADLIIVCEGDSDREVLAHLAQRILEHSPSSKKIEVISALGKIGVPKIVNSLLMSQPEVRVLAVVDSDNDIEGTKSMLDEIITYTNWAPVIIHPRLGHWLGLTREHGRRYPSFEAYSKALLKLDMRELRATDPVFQLFYDEVSAI
ncbi:restriction endonuclease [Pseudomonas sp. LS.1a]|uniref:restriction endonuclease n=1 Tax=Pseudomonas sp. LS.1a TaxID=2920387 RepID=UPI001F14467C|nr:TOPRIM nucleotidyl transferase/hydrolase domain-containing protein [Pseudomonas sp. LS.1a]UMY61656.1 restriction endonuclease [Pseudomonas sp. LS.1a]